MRQTLIATAGIVLVFLAGCARQDEPQPATQDPSQKITQTIEPRPESSGEQVRVHKFDASGIKFRIDISFRDGTAGVEILDTVTGRVKEFKQFLPGKEDGILLTHTKLARDGKTIVWQENRYPDGKLQTQIQQLKNGNLEVANYGPDGKQLVKAVLHQDGSGEYMRWNSWPGRYWLYYVQRWNADGSGTAEMSDQGQQVTRRFELDKAGALLVTWLNPDGSVRWRQHWQSSQAGDGGSQRVGIPGGGWKLDKVEEISSGSLKRTFYFNQAQPFSRRPERVEVPLADGTTRIIWTSPTDGAVQKVQVKDASGKLENVEEEESDKEDARHDWQMVMPPSGFNKGLVPAIKSLFLRG